MKYLLVIFALLAVASVDAQTFQWNTKSGTASNKEVQPESQLQAYEKAYNERQAGLAGIYNPNLHNSRTVYGETHNANELTASHGILPLGTLVKVVNQDNNRNVTVRINDRGQECSDCLITLSQAGADALGINYRGRVTVERVGFSNWNPAPQRTAYQQPAPVYTSSPATYGSAPAAAPTGGVVRPVAIGGETVGWQSKGGPVQQGQVTPQPQPTVTPRSEVAVLGAPSVMSREVDPASRANQPATYSRRPTVVTPSASTTYPTQNQSYPTPAPTAQTTYPAYRQPQTYSIPNQQAPRQQTPTTQQPSPAQVVPQAAPPQPTVQRYQQKGGSVVPESYGQARTTPAAPTTYAAIPAAPVASTPQAGFVVQLGAYNNELYAQNRVNQLKAAGLSNVFYVAFRKGDGQLINRVYAGTFPSMADAQVAANNIRTAHQVAGIVTRL